jgi:hypothetical protein
MNGQGSRRFRFVLPLPGFVLHPLTAVIVAAALDCALAFAAIVAEAGEIGHGAPGVVMQIKQVK